MVTGGNSGTRDYDTSTWIYKFDEDVWESGPPLNHGTSGHACGSFKHQGNIVAMVATGYGLSAFTNITEYWVVDSESGWEQSPPVPTFEMSMANMITTCSPDGKGVLFIGGGTGGKVSDEIFQLVCPTTNLASCPKSCKTRSSIYANP